MIDTISDGALQLKVMTSFFNIFLPGSTGGDAYRIYAITEGYRQRIATACPFCYVMIDDGVMAQGVEEDQV